MQVYSTEDASASGSIQHSLMDLFNISESVQKIISSIDGILNKMIFFHNFNSFFQEQQLNRIAHPSVANTRALKFQQHSVQQSFDRALYQLRTFTTWSSC